MSLIEHMRKFAKLAILLENQVKKATLYKIGTLSLDYDGLPVDVSYAWKKQRDESAAVLSKKPKAPSDTKSKASASTKEPAVVQTPTVGLINPNGQSSILPAMYTMGMSDALRAELLKEMRARLERNQREATARAEEQRRRKIALERAARPSYNPSLMYSLFPSEDAAAAWAWNAEEKGQPIEDTSSGAKFDPHALNRYAAEDPFLAGLRGMLTGNTTWKFPGGQAKQFQAYFSLANIPLKLWKLLMQKCYFPEEGFSEDGAIRTDQIKVNGEPVFNTDGSPKTWAQLWQETNRNWNEISDKYKIAEQHEARYGVRKSNSQIFNEITTPLRVAAASYLQADRGQGIFRIALNILMLRRELDKINEALLANPPPSLEKKLLLLSRRAEVQKQLHYWGEIHLNLSPWDKTRLHVLFPAAALAAAPGIVLEAPKIVASMAIANIASTAALLGAQRYFYKDHDTIIKALSTGSYDGLNAEQQAALDKIISPEDFKDPVKRLQAFRAYLDNVKFTRDAAGIAADSLVFVAPWRAAAKSFARKMFGRFIPRIKVPSSKLPFMRNFWHNTLRQAQRFFGANAPKFFSKATAKEVGKGAAWQGVYYTVPWAFAKTKRMIAGEKDPVIMSPEQFIAWRQQNPNADLSNILLRDTRSTPGDKIKGSVNDMTSLLNLLPLVKIPQLDDGAGDVDSVQNLDLRIKRLREAGVPLNEAGQMALNEARQERLLAYAEKKLPFIKMVHQKVAEARLSQLSTKLRLIKLLPPELQAKALRDLMGTNNLSDYQRTVVLGALSDEKFRKKFISDTWDKPLDLAKYALLFSRMPKNMAGSLFSTLLTNLFSTYTTEDAAQRFINDMLTSEDPFATVREWDSALQRILKALGRPLQGGELLQLYAKNKLWELIKKNPFNIHKMLALMAYRAGYDNLGDFLNSPGAFYGTLVGFPLTVMMLKSVFGGKDKEQPEEIAQQQQELSIKSPVQYSIADRGLFT